MIRTITLGLALAAAANALAPGLAQAQYYDRPYDRPYGERRYDERRYDEDRYRRPPPGFRCDATIRTPYGPRQIVCPMESPRPVGEECHCPPPPGDPYGRPGRGSIIP